MLLFTALAVGASIAFVSVPAVVGFDAFDDLSSPVSIGLLNLGLAALIPAALIAALVAHRAKPGLVSSVVGRLRWKWLLAFHGIALVVVVASVFVSGFVLPADAGDTQEVGAFVGWSTYLPLVLVVLGTTPLQAAGEEYAFRGYLAQAITVWSKRWTWVPVLVTSLLFALAHGQQDPALFTDRFLFGLVMALLVLRTGGLEAAIAMHVMNNLVAILGAGAFGYLDDTLTVTDSSWSFVVIGAVQLAVYSAIVLAVSKRRLQRTIPPASSDRGSAPSADGPAWPGAPAPVAATATPPATAPTSAIAPAPVRDAPVSPSSWAQTQGR
jgi:membrane protease YdiL (CAAX protease family)